MKLRHGKTRQVGQGWQHIHNLTHYRISARQARQLKAEDVPQGIMLHIGAGDDTDCPHCSAVVHRVIRGTYVSQE